MGPEPAEDLVGIPEQPVENRRVIQVDQLCGKLSGSKDHDA
jgi:hypothetical protein